MLFLLLLFLILYVCMHVPMWACASECRCPWRPEVSESLELELKAATTFQYIQYGCWDPNASPLHEQRTFLTPESSLQPLCKALFFIFFPLFLYVYVCVCVLEAVHMCECRHTVQRQTVGGQQTVIGSQSSFETGSLQCFLIHAGS